MHPRRVLPTVRESRKRKGVRHARPKRLFQEDPLYGKIPFLPHSYNLGPAGKTYIIYEPDLDYAPPLPRGAVRANAHLQNLSEFSFPQYFYVDEDKVCV